ncbi:ATP-dependent RNA helicase dbp6 [Emydomyces testavorans]|uniref:ATP-dependent RNA helicase n=1 Tax=Emydomyces testavorans TaxID=2070801 RepID=A0AAF0DAG8_9EURO|nr:ATP-dependent RNA helicase dbp6 [Emydomyces testavorans]
MATPFYARYIPPPTLPSTKPEVSTTSRRRKEVSDNALATKATVEAAPKNPRESSNSALLAGASSSQRRPDKNPPTKSKKKKSCDAQTSASLQNAKSPPAATSKPRQALETSAAQPCNEDAKNRKRKRQSREADGEPPPPLAAQSAETNVEPTSQQSKMKRRAEDDSTMVETPPTKHSKIMSRYEKHRARLPQNKHPTPDEQLAEEATIAYGLTPLPQPAPAPEPSERPSYATLPEWLAHPLVVSPDIRKPFAELGLDIKQTSTLNSRGYPLSMPIQSAVIPLALNGKPRHTGDICISAATGSGKTLAYVLPLVSTIEPSPIKRLRAVIVVPTRELVNQAREACELCATGTGLRIGTAVGSTALRDEQSLLMGRNQVYDREAWKTKAHCLMTSSDWANFNLQEYLAEAKECHNTLPNHVSHTSTNIDILVCTPGRLVEHIRSTKNFTLEHLQWLVIDEADRLLNESFQEWAEIVISATESGDRPDSKPVAPLKHLGSSPERQTPRKIILSATMTKDITKLNSLRLRNPKLVEIRNVDNMGGIPMPLKTLPSDAEGQGYRLPATLCEWVVPVGDGSEKPLYLLQLMASHLGIAAPKISNTSGKLDKLLNDSLSASEESSDNDLSSISSAESDSHSSASASNSIPIDSPCHSALIFTKSSESAIRLARLLALLDPLLTDRIGVLVKSNKSSTARKTLAAYRQGKIQIIIATDRASRGLDLPSLSHVVSYDIPMGLTSYIHRVGRTARAGKEGMSWTLVSHNEGRWFSNEILKGAVDRGGRAVKRITVKPSDDTGLRERYVSALKQLEKEVVASRRKTKRAEVPNA